MDAEAAARAWLEGWARGWCDHDEAAIAELYAPAAVFRTHPFREPHRGPAGAAEYARDAFAGEEAVEVWFAEPVAAGDRASVQYWAISRVAGEDWTIAGHSSLRFAANGCVSEDFEYWTMEEGARRPPDGWGPVVVHERRGQRQGPVRGMNQGA
jgi:SnoaL-like protein